MRFVAGALIIIALWLIVSAAPERSVSGQQVVEPATLELTLAAGGSQQVEKTVEVPAVPAVSDVLIAFDLTGSTGDELDNLQTELEDIIDDLSVAVPDLQMGLVSFWDYPGFFDSSTDPSGCGYSDDYGDAGSGDEPFRVDQAVTSDTDAVKTAVDGMVIKFGEDGPE